MKGRQAADPNFPSMVVMVEPTNFFLNEEAHQDNDFMHAVIGEPCEISEMAKAQHKTYQSVLRDSGIDVMTYYQ